MINGRKATTASLKLEINVLNHLNGKTFRNWDKAKMKNILQLSDY